MRAALFAVVLAGCAGAPAPEPAAEEPELIGGRSTPLAELPATVRLARCTAVKVAPRVLLTAAHCLVDLATMEPSFGPARPATVDGVPRAVAATHLHPAYAAACAATFCSVPEVAQKLDAPDVALLELEEELAGVAVAPVSRRALAPGDRVRLVGFGCTGGVHVGGGPTSPRLATAYGVVAPPADARHEGSALGAADEAVYAGNYALTAGPAKADAAGLCPGDSGGPLYAPDGAVVGVNANYTLRPADVDPVGLPVTNWHTRLDPASRHDVAAFLAAHLR